MGKEMRFGRGLPKIGTELYAYFHSKKFEAKIIEDSDSRKGKVIIVDGERYHSLSTAAESITRYPTNGWKFWVIKE